MRGEFSLIWRKKRTSITGPGCRKSSSVLTPSASTGQNLNLDDLISCKKLVQSFLKEATARAYLVNQERSFTRRGARSILVTVEKINHEVEEIVNGFATRRNDPVEILAALDKIRGLLVDLLA